MTHTNTAPSSIRSADPPGRGYTCIGVRLLDEWAQNQEGGVTLASSRVAEACGVTRPAVAGWRTRARPAPRHWPAIERVTGIATSVWESWEFLGREEAAPSSEERPVTEVSAGPLGSTRDELDSTIRQIDAALRRPVTDGQKVQLLGKRTSALMSRARLEEHQAIADHPDFAPLVEDLVAAVRSVFGPDAPDGLEAQIADEFERLQAARAASPDRRAA